VKTLDPEREKEFLEVLQVFPDDPLPRFSLANLYRDAGQLEDAIIQYRKAIACDQEYGAAYLELGALEEQLGLTDAARETYRNAITAAEKKGDVHIKNRATMRLEDLS